LSTTHVYFTRLVVISGRSLAVLLDAVGNGDSRRHCQQFEVLLTAGVGVIHSPHMVDVLHLDPYIVGCSAAMKPRINGRVTLAFYSEIGSAITTEPSIITLRVGGV